MRKENILKLAILVTVVGCSAPQKPNQNQLAVKSYEAYIAEEAIKQDLQAEREAKDKTKFDQWLEKNQQYLACNTKSECDSQWDRAEVWIATNAPYKIRLATNNVIETFGGHEKNNKAIYIQLSRSLTKDDVYSFNLEINCTDHYQDCLPNRIDTAIALYTAMYQLQ